MWPLLAVGASATVASILALFLPWTFATVRNVATGQNQVIGYGLSDYAAPDPSVVAWFLLAFGLAVCIVSVVSLAFGGKKGTLTLAAGGLLYGIGAFIWYAATVLPSLVASGCLSNGGTLCSLTAGSPTVGSVPGAGFYLGVAAAVVTLATGIGGFLFLRETKVPLTPG